MDSHPIVALVLEWNHGMPRAMPLEHGLWVHQRRGRAYAIVTTERGGNVYASIAVVAARARNGHHLVRP
ncbi:MAG: hypothetical protein CYG59_17205 [Chloroflexi bacterium]|nr:MAG: hypothetical protein CYG59_17205 [Chloroflexota bacterium]